MRRGRCCEQGHEDGSGVAVVDEAAGRAEGAATVDESAGKAESVDKAALIAEGLLLSLRLWIKQGRRDGGVVSAVDIVAKC